MTLLFVCTDLSHPEHPCWALALPFPMRIRARAHHCGTHNAVELCSWFGSCLCCKYRTRIRDAQMSAELEPGFGDWLRATFQKQLLRLPKLAPVSGSPSLFLILNHRPSVVNLHHVVPNRHAEQRALEPHTAGATRWRMSLCAEMDYPEQGWKSCRKNLSCLFLFLAENGDKTLLFTVVCHLCPKMKTRMEKIFIWTFRTIKNIGSKIGQRISSVVGCSELFV